ncbi:MAG: DnaJ C-terminal domain-containing protein [Candidatus Gastranaerophilales bacterium]
MIKPKNYYEILELTPNCDGVEIKTAYRRLARKYHPDINPSCEKLFKEVSQAYETLSDEKKRKQYDIINGIFKTKKVDVEFDKPNFQSKSKAEDFDKNGFGKQEFHKEASYKTKIEFENSKQDFSHKINDIFEEFKRSNQQEYYKKQKEAKKNPIDGEDIFSDVRVSISEAYNGASKVVNILHTEQCPKCRGRKFINGSLCQKCSGSGEISEYRKITVQIPAKLKNNTKLRIKGEGKQGKFGGKNGDLYLKVSIEPNSKIKYEGLDILYILPITPFEAVLGGKISVPTFDGDVSLKIPVGTNSGQKFRLAGQGLSQKNKTGDMIITVNIEIDSCLSDDEKKLYEKLKKLSQHNVRENLFNDFKK